MKKKFSFVLAVCLLINICSVVVFAEENVQTVPTTLGVIVEDGLKIAEDGKGSTVMLQTNVLVKGGLVKLKDRSPFNVDSKLYYNQGTTFTTYDLGVGVTKPPKYCQYLEGGTYDVTYPDIPEFYGESLTTLDDIVLTNKDVIVSESVYISSVSFQKTANLVFDTGIDSTLYVKIDNMDFSGTSTFDKSAVRIIGGGKVVLQVGNMTGEKSKNFNYPTITNVTWQTYQRTNDNFILIYENTANQPLKQLRVEGDVYFTNSVDAYGVFNVVGNVVTSGDLSYKGKLTEGVAASEEFNVIGDVIVPNGMLHTTNAARIRGVVYAKTAELLGNTTVVYAPSSYIVATPDENVKIPDVNPDIPVGDNVTPGYETKPTPEPVPTPVPGGGLVPDNEVNTPEVAITTNYAYIYGYNDVTMSPDNAITRGQAAVMIYRVLYQEGKCADVSITAQPSFGDVDSTNWQYAALEYMTAIGVYDKSASSRISPDEKVTRGEIAKMIAFSLGLKPTGEDLGFSDIKPGDKYYQYIDALVSNGYLNGYGDSIGANNTMTRAEFVTMFNRIIGRNNGTCILTDKNGVAAPNTFIDISEHWAFEEIMLATHSFADDKYVDNSLRMNRDELDSIH